jgi:hypothetical protein
MNKSKAKAILDQITNEHIEIMFKNAKRNISNWEQISVLNKSFTKAMAWEILSKSFDKKSRLHEAQKLNLIREFGEYLPEGAYVIKQREKVVNDCPF